MPRMTSPGNHERRDDAGNAAWFDASPVRPAGRAGRALPARWRAVAVLAAVIGVVAAAAVTARLVPEPAPTSTGAAPTAASTPVADLTGAAEAARSLQVVPPLAGVVVHVGGRAVASDAAGRIDVRAATSADEVVIAPSQSPSPATTVAFTGWGDGSTASARPLAELRGGVVELGVSVAYEVRLSGGSGTVTLVSADGARRVTVGDRVSLVAARAERRDGHLEAVTLTYAARDAVDAQGAPVDEVTAATFVPAPDATWPVLG